MVCEKNIHPNGQIGLQKLWKVQIFDKNGFSVTINVRKSQIIGLRHLSVIPALKCPKYHKFVGQNGGKQNSNTSIFQTSGFTRLQISLKMIKWSPGVLIYD